MTSSDFLDMLRTAAMQARIAAHLYRGRRYVERFAADHHASCIYVEARHVRAAVLVFRDHVHLTVCGTDDIRDWLDNVSARQTRWQGLRVHGGFARATKSLLPAFTSQNLIRHVHTRPLVIGGHSAGGAIAELLSTVRWLHPREVVTFGSPRVFSPDSAACYGAKDWSKYRFVSGGDPVPGLPLRRFRCLFGRAEYSHTSQPIEIAKDGDIAIGQEIGITRSIARHAASLIFGSGIGRASLIEKHGIERYAERMAAALSRYGA